MEIIAKYIHGSENSLDTDVMYVVDELPSLQECKTFCSDKVENRNLIVIEDGIVTKCYKGTPDECNNSLFATYKLHHQSDELLVTRTVDRDKRLKTIRALRGILSHLSRTSYRPQIKEALRSEDWDFRVDVLRSIDLTTIDFDSIQNNMSGADIKKLIAFQIVQTVALWSGVEIYTKNEACSYMNFDLSNFINRKDDDISILQSSVQFFCYICKTFDMSEYDIKLEKKK